MADEQLRGLMVGHLNIDEITLVDYSSMEARWVLPDIHFDEAPALTVEILRRAQERLNENLRRFIGTRFIEPSLLDAFYSRRQEEKPLIKRGNPWVQ